MNVFERLRMGLSKTRERILGAVGDDTEAAPTGEFVERVEEALVAADIGVDRVSELLELLNDEISRGEIRTVSSFYARLKGILKAQLTVESRAEEFPPRPWVVLVTGVNGVGKTTTIGKLAHEYRGQGKKVMLAAADTFRAGAIEQLRIWAERTHSEFVAQQPGADPASVAFDALEAAKARGIDVLLIDTAGRLHSKENLMQELQKVARVIRRNTPHAPNETLLVVDGSTGQNAIRQARAFNDALGLTGLIVTKLDGTAKGGAVLAITRSLKVPVQRVGVGEGIDDLQVFDPDAFVDALLGDLGVRPEQT
jgi:fused signal recognition particle receptor